MKESKSINPPIKLIELRKVFFPKDFYEKYNYLGSIPWKEDGDILKVLRPLIILMDLKAKPWWCPRWFLRLLNLLGNDNSLVRVRNIRLSNLFTKITNGYRFWDYKTKWSDYDLRITIAGDDELWYLVDSIEQKYYKDGRKNFLIDKLTNLDPKTNYQLLSFTDLEKKDEELSPKY